MWQKALKRRLCAPLSDQKPPRAGAIQSSEAHRGSEGRIPLLPNPIALPIERRGAVEDVDRRLTPGRPARRRGFPPSPLVIEVGTVRRRPSSRVAEWRTRGVLRVE